MSGSLQKTHFPSWSMNSDFIAPAAIFRRLILFALSMIRRVPERLPGSSFGAALIYLFCFEAVTFLDSSNCFFSIHFNRALRSTCFGGEGFNTTSLGRTTPCRCPFVLLYQSVQQSRHKYTMRPSGIVNGCCPNLVWLHLGELLRTDLLLPGKPAVLTQPRCLLPSSVA